MRLLLEEKRIIIGLNISYYRRARKLTQGQLAERVQISSNYLSQIERGFKNVSLVTLTQISEVLGIEEVDLWDFSRSNMALEQGDNELSHRAGKTFQRLFRGGQT